MRMPMCLVVLAALALSTGAYAGGSPAEIRKTITGRVCSSPGVNFHFGRDGTFRRHRATSSGMRFDWQGTYTISEGTVALYIQKGGPVGPSVVTAWVSGNTFHASTIAPTGLVMSFVCR
jgi:hypothetical protein